MPPRPHVELTEGEAAVEFACRGLLGMIRMRLINSCGLQLQRSIVFAAPSGRQH